jgi:nucleoside-diphosphate-sugar epimerase
MKVLIIGGTGLISSAIVRELAAQKNNITLYNRGGSVEMESAGIKVVRGDRRDYAQFEAQMSELGNFDCVIDMVGYEPEDALSATRAFRGRTEQFLFCSTVDVYLKPAFHYPITPDSPQLGLNDYARKKVIQEAALTAASARGDFNLTILRPAFTYGEGGGLVHSFGGGTAYLDRIRKGKPIVVHGDGTSFWVACHRDDVGAGFARAVGNPKTFGKTYNVAGEEWMTWNQYHNAVAQAMEAPVPTLVHIPTDTLANIAPERAGICLDNFQFNNIFDNSKSHEDFGFEYTINFDSGVRRIVNWLNEHNRMADSDADPYDDRIIAAWEKVPDYLRSVLN